jgi:DNA-directed RNA polymerase I subunit RPA2
VLVSRGKHAGPSYSDKAVAMRCVRPDMTSMTIRVHYLNDGRATVAFTLRKREYFIPVALLLRVRRPPARVAL